LFLQRILSAAIWQICVVIKLRPILSPTANILKRWRNHLYVDRHGRLDAIVEISGTGRLLRTRLQQPTYLVACSAAMVTNSQVHMILSTNYCHWPNTSGRQTLGALANKRTNNDPTVSRNNTASLILVVLL
jgi:hypothetical protein